MTGDIGKVFAALNEAGVRYLVVGGVAVVLHGRLRATADLDLVLDLDRENVLRALKALESLDFLPRAPVEAEAFADPEIREAWVVERNLEVFTLWSPRFTGFQVDLFARVPFDFVEAYSRAVRVSLHTAEATVASLDDLIEMKRGSDRPVDIEDVAMLEAIREECADD